MKIISTKNPLIPAVCVLEKQDVPSAFFLTWIDEMRNMRIGMISKSSIGLSFTVSCYGIFCGLLYLKQRI